MWDGEISTISKAVLKKDPTGSSPGNHLPTKVLGKNCWPPFTILEEDIVNLLDVSIQALKPQENHLPIVSLTFFGVYQMLCFKIL